ncbi:MAG: TonB-dependent receptor [Fidelibacterota bacterium]
MNRTVRVLALFLLPLYAFGQNTISGNVSDAATGNALPGANVVVEGTSMGAAANTEGAYTITNVPAGTYTVTASVIGYADVSKTVNVSGDITVNFALETSALELSALEVLASRATRNTPVAYSNIKKEDMELRLGSRDIPLVMNTTPSVYATAQGGGAGDARVNVRGFNQRNVAIMINGVPVNDMENGWVYWSNWDGVGDATSSIQMQRGLSAVNLATPSIGGTMNIITDPAAHQAGGRFKQELGSGGFLKTTLNYNTGLIDNKMALSATIVRKTGDGIIDATWTDAWAWYIGASYQLTNADRLEFYALAAPQRHGQNLYKQNIGAYSHSFAKGLKDYDEAALYDDSDPDNPTGKFKEVGQKFNQNWAKVSSYNGKQYWAMYMTHKKDDRHESGFINERENFFDKPQVNLNWYHTFNQNMYLSSIFYWSGGHGGGTGTYGRIYTRDAAGELGDDNYKYYYGPSPWYRDWDETIAMNEGPADTYYVDKRKLTKDDGESLGILRNSRNNQSTLGAISKLNYDVSDNLKTIFGIDWRTATIDHFREVRDLLGGDYYIKTADEFNPDQKVGLGDKIAYYETNTVDWLGFFGQGEYTAGPLAVYGTFGYSTIKYSFTDHFVKDDNGNELKLKSPDNISGIQIKGGGVYHLTDAINIFANFGQVEKVPILDAVIDDVTKVKASDPKNEVFTSVEGGVDFALMNKMVTGKANFYNTQWKDRSLTKHVTNEDGDTDVIFFTGMDQTHTGIELEAAFQPMSLFRLDLAASFGDWTHDNDVTGKYKTYSSGVQTEKDYNYYIKGLKIGDAPQTQIALGATVFPIKGAQAQIVFKKYDNFYADWDPTSRTSLEDANDDGVAEERPQSWKTPGYNKIDVHAYYNLPFDLSGVKLQVFAHIFNLTDELYVQDAVDNSKYNAYTSNGKDHSADDAEVFMGLPRSINMGVSVRF